MDIDFYKEIKYYLKIFNSYLLKRKVNQADIESMILIIDDITYLLNLYIDYYFD